MFWTTFLNVFPSRFQHTVLFTYGKKIFNADYTYSVHMALFDNAPKEISILRVDLYQHSHE